MGAYTNDIKNIIVDFYNNNECSIPQKVLIEKLIKRKKDYGQDDLNYRLKHNGSYIKTVQDFVNNLDSYTYVETFTNNCFTTSRPVNVNLAVVIDDIIVDINHHLEDDGFFSTYFGTGSKKIILYLGHTGNNTSIEPYSLSLIDADKI